MKTKASISAYTPSNTAPELLKRIFVQRENMLKKIVDRLSRSMSTGDKYHILLVGPRGSGKTHLVSLVEWELRKKEELMDSMRIAWLGEDDSFTGFVYLAFGIAKQLAEEYPDEFSKDFKTPVRGLPPDEAALGVLTDVVKRLGDRNLLLITENLDFTFKGLGDSGQKKWRAFLQETRKTATLATTQQLFSGVTSRSEAFFGFFDIQHLEPLGIDDARELMYRISDEQNRTSLRDFLGSPEGKYRLRALHYLAGGNHRIYVLLAEFLTKESLNDLVAAFEELANDMTPYFQERIRSLPDQQKQLIQCLCDAEGALTVIEVAQETFIEQRTCSKQLGNLKTKGYVRSEKRGKESYYDMSEPLMRLCLEAKNQRGRPLKLIARFLRAWFTTTQLQTGNAEPSKRFDLYRQEALKTPDIYRNVIAEQLGAEILNCVQAGRSESIDEFMEELIYADKQSAEKLKKRLRKSEAGSESIHLHMKTADSLKRQEQFYFLKKEWAKAIENFTSILEFSDAPSDQKAEALIYRGFSYGQQENIEKAVTDYSEVIELSDVPSELKAIAFFSRGVTYGQQGDMEKALADLSAAIEFSDASSNIRADAFFNRGVIHGQQRNMEKALADYSAVINLSKISSDQKAESYINRGVTYAQQGNIEKALADLSTVIELSDSESDMRAGAFFNRGVAYGQQGNVKKELADYSAVIEFPDAAPELKANAYINRGSTRWRNLNFKGSQKDFEAVLLIPGVPSGQKTIALFSVVEPMIELQPKSAVIKALRRAFKEGDRSLDRYAGTPHDLLWMVLRRAPQEWKSYVESIALLFIEHGVAEKLGLGVTKSIGHLDQEDYSSSQLDLWNDAWQNAGKNYEDLEIPLLALNVGIEVLKSNPVSDRPLFKLPLEIRNLVRPLLNNTLGPEEE